jgi:hypothetical protein
MPGRIPLLLADFIQAREPQTNLRISLDITAHMGQRVGFFVLKEIGFCEFTKPGFC